MGRDCGPPGDWSGCGSDAGRWSAFGATGSEYENSEGLPWGEIQEGASFCSSDPDSEAGPSAVIADSTPEAGTSIFASQRMAFRDNLPLIGVAPVGVGGRR